MILNICCNDFERPIGKDWIGCDGKVLSDSLIKSQMDSAVEDERYERAAKCRDELIRRRNKKGAIL